ncbi:MAG: hypothetical protein IKG69_07095 [Atopobiaceae bacterium]|nr:hypothetical protein [Atopobiaceae bacterium]MBR3384951.1 hypothetical protein [Atopobiaceae bacterium]
MEREKGRNSRQASPRPTAHRAPTSIARPYDYRADLLDQIKGLALTALAWLIVAALGALMAWCLMCPDYHPISKAEWEAQLAARSVGAE